MSKPLVVAIIPARSGSKSIPQKNLLSLAGVPLVARSVKTAIDSASCDRVFVSTDSIDIADVAKNAGAEVPFLRPQTIAQDDTPDAPVCLHLLEFLRARKEAMPEFVAWLRPTSPLRQPCDIVSALQIAIDKKADYVRSVCLAREHPYWLKRFDAGKLTPFIPGKDESTYFQRQTLPPAYRITGAVDIFRTSKFLETGQLYDGVVYGYEMPHERSVELDDLFDLAVINTLLNQRSYWPDVEEKDGSYNGCS